MAALGFALLPPFAPEPHLLHCWLDTWRGVGDVVVGMVRQDYDVQLTRYGRPRVARDVLHERVEHSVTSSIGSAWEPTPWRAVQRAAWAALDNPRAAA